MTPTDRYLLTQSYSHTHTYTLSVLRLPQQAEPHSVMLYIWVLTLASNMWTTIKLLVWIQDLPFPLGYDEPCWCLQIPYTHSHESPWWLFGPRGELSGWGLYPGPRLTLCALAIRDTTSQQGPYERNTPSFFGPVLSFWQGWTVALPQHHMCSGASFILVS